MKYTYHTSHSFREVSTGRTTSMQSQLYEIGVYVIVDNDPARQQNVVPQVMVQMEKHVQRLLSEKKIDNLTWGPEITVEQVDGFWKEVEP